MKFLAITRRNTAAFTPEQFAELLVPEAVAARGLYARGDFREIYSRGDVPGAVIVVEAADAGAAHAIVAGLPLAQKGMMDFEIVPLLPYRGFVG